MKGSFFPEHYARENCNFYLYSAIAFRSYCFAAKACDRICSDEELLIGGREDYLVDENAAICETFSAFAIESYLNTYAAACMSDSVFYDNYERLSALSKLQLIANTVFHETVTKQDELYYLLKQAFSTRDYHAHSKSHASNIGMTDAEMEEWEAYSDDHYEEIIQEKMLTSRNRLNDVRRNALLSLKALAGIACYIDEHDSSAYARAVLLRNSPGSEIYGSSFSEEMNALANELMDHFS